MVKPEWLDAGQFGKVKTMASEAVELLKELRATQARKNL